MVLKRISNFITSLWLTVVCLALAMVLVFIGTLAQVNLGLYEAQSNYFQSFFVFWQPQGATWRIPVFPGGYLLGSILLVNLIAAHLKRFTISRKKIGIFLVHAGLILLLVGQLVTELISQESAMRLVEGETSNFSQSFRDNELVVVDTSSPDKDKVVSIPESRVASAVGGQIVVPDTPLTLRIHQYWPNSDLTNAPVQGAIAIGVTNGVGDGLFVLNRREVTKMDDRDLPSAIVEVLTPKGSLGSWLVSSQIGRKQTLTFDGRTYELALRFTRHYKPFRVELLDFRHDKYAGTAIAKNFSSDIRVINPSSGEDRKVHIEMNEPWRVGVETYYQGSFDPKDARVSILQVVRNPGWLTPYVACVLVAGGLVVQFLYHLVGFVNKRRSA